eukprot:6840320-Alexandrium_andersonii.AAC.1
MEVEELSQSEGERVEAEATEATRARFPGIPLRPTEEYGDRKDLCREAVLKFCELTAYLFGGDPQAMAQA